jgi:hypothetical protein
MLAAMDPLKLRAWIAAKIEEHAPDNERDSASAVRLVDAVAALRREPGKTTVFGLALPAQGVVDPEPLVARGIELLRIWEQVIDPDLRDELAMLAKLVHIPVASQPRPVRAPTTHQLQIWLPVVLDDFEAAEETIYTSPAILQSFDGVRLRDARDLIELPCLRIASGGDPGAVSNYPVHGWATGGEIALAFDPERSTLSARLTFELTCAPSAEELERFLTAVRDELLFTGWGMNLDWDCEPDPETISIHLQRQVERYAVTARVQSR